MSAAPSISESLRALMAEVGPRWGEAVTQHVKQMVDEYSRVLVDQPTDGIRVTRGLAYGTHPRQVLDVYQPQNSQALKVRYKELELARAAAAAKEQAMREAESQGKLSRIGG